MTPTPCTIAPPRPYYVRNATNHADIPGQYATHEEAAAARDRLSEYNDGRLDSPAYAEALGIFKIMRAWIEERAVFG